MIRPLRAGDIVAFPYLDAVGRYTGEALGTDTNTDTLDVFEWHIPPGGPLSIGHLPTLTDGEADAMLDTGEIVILETDFDSLGAYDAYRTYRDCDPRLVSPSGAPSTKSLGLRAERGSGARERVNGFLKHPSVAYQHDPVTRPFRLALTATYRGREVAMAVLGRPSGRHNADGRTVELYRFAAHPDRPANTGSWLLARCCRWAELEGYDRLLTYAGVQNDNDGTMYRAAGFEHLDTTTADRSHWHSRSGRTGNGTYTKRRFQRRLVKHVIEPRRPAGRISVEQSRLTDRGTAPGMVCAPPRRIVQAELIQTREETPGRRTATLSPAAQALIKATSSASTGRGPVTTAPLIACFGYRTSENALVTALCVRDHSETQNPRNNHGAITVDAVAAQTDTLAHPVNIVRSLIADAVEWAHLHGYATVETNLEGTVATDALAGLALPHAHRVPRAGRDDERQARAPSSA